MLKEYWDLHYYRIIWELLWCCGMRPIEVCWLQIQNFSENFDQLGYKTAKYKNVKKYGKIIKTYKSRIVPIPPKLTQKIIDYIDMNKFMLNNGFLFPSLDRKRMKRGNFFMCPRTLNYEMNRLRPVLRGRFLEKNTHGDHLIAPHSFRRSWITRYMNQCKNPFKTAKAIGHADPNVTFQYYQDNNFEDLKDFVNAEYLDYRMPYVPKDQTKLGDFCN